MNENPIDRYLPEAIRSQIEQAYYARVTAQSQFELLIRDASFWQNPLRHPALFSDHGIVHVRDVAQQILQILKTINGVLIPARDQSRLDNFMYGYSVMLAYFHDIGMADLSEFGRAMHPEFAAQAVFAGDLDHLIETMWAENCGNVPGHLARLANEHILKRDPKIIFREILAMSVGHSKSKIPVTVLDNAGALRSHMQYILSHSLYELYYRQQAARGKPAGMERLDEQLPQFLSTYYSDFTSEAFDWLSDDHDATRDLVNDVTDCLRALRCADALRQRGTVQKTSGGYEVFVSQHTGNAICALRLGNEKLYLLELPDDPISVGEANIASCEFDIEGNLHISFHRGAYANDEAFKRSVYATALTISDFLVDIVDSFWREGTPDGSLLKTSKDIQICLESSDDNPRFVEILQDKLRQLIPSHSDQVQIVPSLNNISQLELNRYLAARELNWDLDQRRVALEHMAQSGLKIDDFQITEGFKHVKLIHLQAGEKLIEAGERSAFVYIPLGEGLKIVPLGGYKSFSVAGWMPLGNTGVIRGATRNADVFTEHDISLLMIPKEVYLRYWYAPYTHEELKKLLANDAS
jgi:hypothetical protein